MGEEFNPEEPLTHGIHLGQLTENHLPIKKTDSIQMSVWDFGGQEVFYGTHQFFLNRDAIYILAWTAEEKCGKRSKKGRTHQASRKMARPR